MIYAVKAEGTSQTSTGQYVMYLNNESAGRMGYMKSRSADVGIDSSGFKSMMKNFDK